MLGGQRIIAQGPIRTTYDNDIRAFVVRMPEYVSFEELERWRGEFLLALGSSPGGHKVALLLDTNMHRFDSTECLKLLRDLLEDERNVKRYISRVAFVQPQQYRDPEIVSTEEAYFLHFEEAYHWLENRRGTK